ncbi:MAG: hypothetical protein WA749_00250, partial [Gelidibacter sp.]
MTKPLKITFITLLVLLVLGVIGYFVADAIIASNLDNFLKSKLPENTSVDYESVDINIWQGSVVMVRPKILSKASGTSKVRAEIELDTIIVDGFGYWSYLIKNDIHMESVQLRSPKLCYNYDKAVPKNESNNSSLNGLKQEIKVDRFNIQNGKLSIRDMATDSIMLHSERVTANFMSILLNAASVKKPLPFSFEDYNLSFNDLFYSMGAYENLTISDAQITQEKATFHQMKIFTKYSKVKLSQIISTERDHFDIIIPSLIFEHQKFGYEQDSVFYFKCRKVIFENPEMFIYRNKLIVDDIRPKDLYSKMLRDMKFDLTLSEVQLKDATIVYSEKVNIDMQAGKLSFTKMKA